MYTYTVHRHCNMGDSIHIIRLVMVHAIYAFVQSKRSGTTAEEQTNDGRKTEEVAPSVLRVVCPDSVRGWELLLVVGVEHRGGFKIVVLAVFHLEIFWGLLFLLFFFVIPPDPASPFNRI